MNALAPFAPTLDLDVAEIAAWRFLYDHAGMEVFEAPGLVALVAPSIDHVLFNRMLVGPGLTRGALAQALTRMPSRYWIQGELWASERAWLAAHGIGAYRRDWVKLLRPLDTPTGPPDLRVEVGTMAVAAPLYADAFDMPPAAVPVLAGADADPRWTTLVVRDGDTLAGAASLFVHGRTGYLAMAATAPAHRRRGVQSALIRARLDLARRLGCEQALSETGAAVPGVPNPSHDNLVRAGFVPVRRRPNFAPLAAAWDHGRG